MDLIGEIVGHIRIRELIGEGGMGAVYAGFDEKTGDFAPVDAAEVSTACEFPEKPYCGSGFHWGIRLSKDEEAFACSAKVSSKEGLGQAFEPQVRILGAVGAFLRAL